MLVADHDRRERPGGRRREREVPRVHSRRLGQWRGVFSCATIVGAGGVQPLVAVGVVEVPVRVHELLDRIGADSLKGGGDLRPRHGEARIHQELAVAPREHADVPAGAFKHVDVSAQGANRISLFAASPRAVATIPVSWAFSHVGTTTAAAPSAPSDARKRRRDGSAMSNVADAIVLMSCLLSLKVSSSDAVRAECPHRTARHQRREPPPVAASRPSQHGIE